MKEMSRRDLFKIGGVAAAGAMGASMLAGCSPSGEKKSEGGNAAADDKKVNDIAGHYRAGTPSFLTAPDPITDIKETKEYDVVIVALALQAFLPRFPPKRLARPLPLSRKKRLRFLRAIPLRAFFLTVPTPRAFPLLYRRCSRSTNSAATVPKLNCGPKIPARRLRGSSSLPRRSAPRFPIRPKSGPLR